MLARVAKLAQRIQTSERSCAFKVRKKYYVFTTLALQGRARRSRRQQPSGVTRVGRKRQATREKLLPDGGAGLQKKTPAHQLLDLKHAKSAAVSCLHGRWDGSDFFGYE